MSKASKAELSAKIIALQHELRRAKRTINRLMKDVDYADDVFADTCDCSPFDGGECGPCIKRRTFQKHVADAKTAIKRIELAQGK